jgi:hypothetical protein
MNEPKVADTERFNKQTSYQDLLLDNTELRTLIRTQLIPRSLVLEVLDAYTDHIASPNQCDLLREIRAEVLRIRTNPDL